MKKKVLLLEGIHKDAVKYFREKGYQVERLPKALPKKELLKKVKDISILGIRSKTTVDEDLLAAAPKLRAIGGYLIGLNKIDLAACTKRGINVFNAPFSSGRSVAELTIGLIVALLRRMCERSEEMHKGIWSKSAEGCFEVRGKVLGIVGYGNIGTQVSTLAEDMGMKVIFSDVVDKAALGNSKKAKKLDELLQTADIVTLHVTENPSSINLMDAKRIKMMKKGSYLINLSRGTVVDIKALKQALKRGALAGAALDVYPKEPASNKEKFQSELRGLKNVILSPHIGASTQEAQRDIALSTSRKVNHYLTYGTTLGSVNLPQVFMGKKEDRERFVHVHNNVPGVLSKLNSLIAKKKLNIEAQYLETSGSVGYAVIDVNKKLDAKTLKEIEAMEETIRVMLI